MKVKVIRLASAEDWWRAIKCGSLELALKYHSPMPSFPCLLMQQEAEPDWGPGAPDKNSYFHDDDLMLIHRVLWGQLPVSAIETLLFERS